MVNMQPDEPLRAVLLSALVATIGVAVLVGVLVLAWVLVR
jgi:hypothetical protein